MAATTQSWLVHRSGARSMKVAVNVKAPVARLRGVHAHIDERRRGVRERHQGASVGVDGDFGVAPDGPAVAQRERGRHEAGRGNDEIGRLLAQRRGVEIWRQVHADN